LDNKELTRNEQIHAKGFNIDGGYRDYACIDSETDFKRIKVGVKQLDDAVLNLGSLKSCLPPNHKFADKKYIFKMIMDRNIEELRNISNFYYNMNGIYERVCNYFA